MGPTVGEVRSARPSPARAGRAPRERTRRPVTAPRRPPGTGSAGPRARARAPAPRGPRTRPRWAARSAHRSVGDTCVLRGGREAHRDRRQRRQRLLHLAHLDRPQEGGPVFLRERQRRGELQAEGTGEAGRLVVVHVLDEPQPVGGDAPRLAEPQRVDAGAGGDRGEEQVVGRRRRAVASGAHRLVGDDGERADLRGHALASGKADVDVHGALLTPQEPPAGERVARILGRDRRARPAVGVVPDRQVEERRMRLHARATLVVTQTSTAPSPRESRRCFPAASSASCTGSSIRRFPRHG